jgi:hypothetical protein
VFGGEQDDISMVGRVRHAGLLRPEPEPEAQLLPFSDDAPGSVDVGSVRVGGVNLSLRAGAEEVAAAACRVNRPSVHLSICSSRNGV